MFLTKMLRAVDHPYIVGPGGRKVRANTVAKNLTCVLEILTSLFFALLHGYLKTFAGGEKTLT
jgi:hypothetical protein